MIMLYAGVLALGIVQILTVIAIFFGLVELRAMQKSTHSIQYVPVDQGFQKVTEEVKTALGKDLFDNVV